MKASMMEIDDKLSFLFKGPWGYGKTLAAASFAALGPIHISYWDKKKPVELIDFFKNVIRRPDLLDNIEYDVYGASNAHAYVNKYIDFVSDCRYSAVITDSVTSLTAGAVNWSMGFRDPKGAKKDKLNRDAVQLIPDFDEYKVETSLVTQVLDMCIQLPCHVIWIAHPLPQIKVEGSGNSIKVSKANSIVTYGSKVAGIIPGKFTEIYHFSTENNYDENGLSKKFIVNTTGIGDDFAKSAINLPPTLDITNKLFYEVWHAAVKAKEGKNDEVTKESNPIPSVKIW